MIFSKLAGQKLIVSEPSPFKFELYERGLLTYLTSFLPPPRVIIVGVSRKRFNFKRLLYFNRNYKAHIYVTLSSNPPQRLFKLCPNGQKGPRQKGSRISCRVILGNRKNSLV